MSDQPILRSARSHKLSTIARHGRLKHSNPVVTVVKFLAAAMAVVLVSGVSVAAIATLDVASSAQPGVHLANETNGPVPQIGAITGGVNLLIVGSDSRKGQDAAFGPDDSTGDLNDVTMLLHISQDHTNASVISFPRDMFVPIPACPDPSGGTFNSMSRQKINTTLTYGGLACTVLTVEKLTGLTIPFAAEVQFSGVMAMSTAVGGVPVCVAEEIQDEYTGTFLKPGMHTLEGVAALQFLRTRHGVGDGSDLTRINNQQVFMSALVRTIKSASTLSDPIKVYSLAKAVTANMKLSDSLNNVSVIASIAVALKDIDLNEVVFVQVPTGGTTGGVLPLQPDFKDLFTAVAADKALKLGGTTGRGATLDPSATAPPAPAATTDASAPPAPTASAGATPTPTPTDAATLSESATGQTAGELTCSVGRTLNNQ
ncbi:LCP family protein [Cryobacterium zhongshanensis]|uniref:LCP family protein n=1 Tax=Cryobacterium zhongshanensis TaxID=2928153 RepID=A0AA41R0E3_9MICO|nr:LCP family protein [Cryobacterium zhongshanensis]MCI4659041.1 LCP family protein [Cryobacterium zhongshanensis]